MALLAATLAISYAQEKTVMVGGAVMYPSKNIVQNAVNSKDHTTLAATVKAAGLVETLSSPGPFTVFAPTNTAFNKLPVGRVDNLIKAVNKATLTSMLTYHVVAGKMDAKVLMYKVKAGNGTAALKTVQSEELSFMQKGKNLVIKDAKGNTAMVTIKDVYQNNGVIPIIDRVLMP